MIILKRIWSRIELLSNWHQKPKNYIRISLSAIFFIAQYVVVFVNYCFETVVVKKLEQELEVKSVSWTLEEILVSSLIYLFIQQAFTEILPCPRHSSNYARLKNQENTAVIDI